MNIIIALAAGNFFYQWMQVDPNWVTAAERSYFQTMAILFYMAYLKWFKQ